MSSIYVFLWLFNFSFGTPACGPDAPPATIEIVQPRSDRGGSRAFVPRVPTKDSLHGEKFFRRY